MHINIDDSTLEKIEELSKLYKETWGKEIDIERHFKLKCLFVLWKYGCGS